MIHTKVANKSGFANFFRPCIALSGGFPCPGCSVRAERGVSAEGTRGWLRPRPSPPPFRAPAPRSRSRRGAAKGPPHRGVGGPGGACRRRLRGRNEYFGECRRHSPKCVRIRSADYFATESPIPKIFSFSEKRSYSSRSEAISSRTLWIFSARHAFAPQKA